MKNNSEYTYRLMKSGEENALLLLILRVFHQHVAPTYSKEGIETFLNMLTVDFLKAADPKKFTLVAEYEHRPVGMLTNINEGHIALLFVDSEFQGRGIGAALIRRCIDECSQKYPGLNDITVSSSPNSRLFYERLGFIEVYEEQDENGLRFIPMQKEI